MNLAESNRRHLKNYILLGPVPAKSCTVGCAVSISYFEKTQPQSIRCPSIRRRGRRRDSFTAAVPRSPPHSRLSSMRPAWAEPTAFVKASSTTTPMSQNFSQKVVDEMHSFTQTQIEYNIAWARTYLRNLHVSAAFGRAKCTYENARRVFIGWLCPKDEPEAKRGLRTRPTDLGFQKKSPRDFVGEDTMRYARRQSPALRYSGTQALRYFSTFPPSL